MYIYIGSVCFFVLAVIPSTKKLFHQVRENYTIGLGARRIAAFIVGGSILGMGMTVSGAVSPSTVELELCMVTHC